MSFTFGDIILIIGLAVLIRSFFTDNQGQSTYTPPPQNDDLKRLREIADYDRWEKSGRDAINPPKRDISKDI